jgi:hypothetical protein
MLVIFTQNCTMSIGNMTVKAFIENEEYELEGEVLAKSLAEGRCIPKPEKPTPSETKQAEPVAENKAVGHPKPSKKAK